MLVVFLLILLASFWASTCIPNWMGNILFCLFLLAAIVHYIVFLVPTFKELKENKKQFSTAVEKEKMYFAQASKKVNETHIISTSQNSEPVSVNTSPKESVAISVKKHIISAKNSFYDCVFINIDGTVRYPSNSSFDIKERLWDETLPNNDRKEIYDRICQSYPSVERLPEYYALMIRLSPEPETKAVNASDSIASPTANSEITDTGKKQGETNDERIDTRFLTETTPKTSFLETSKKEIGNYSALPPQPPISTEPNAQTLPSPDVQKRNAAIGASEIFTDQIDTRTIGEAMLPDILKKEKKKKKELSDVFYINIDGTVCYPTNSSFDIIDRLWDNTLSDEDKEELLYSCFQNILGVKNLTDYTLMVSMQKNNM